MNKSAPSLGRIAAMVVFALSCFGLLLFLWLAFGGPVPLKPVGYRVHLDVPEATTLAKEADVRISGVPVGKVTDIQPDKRTGRSDVTIELQSRYVPLHANAQAILRQKTLLGETYVEITPGTTQAAAIPEGGSLGSGQVSNTVQLDEILRTFDPQTRAAFQEWMQQQALAIGPHGRDVNEALGNLGPFADDAARMASILNQHSTAVTQLISNTGVVFDALTQRDGQLSSLIRNANIVFSTTAARNRDLQAAFIALPTFERESRATLIRLTQFAHNTNPLVTQLRPAARQLSPTLQQVELISPDLKSLFTQLNPLITASKAGFPAAQRVLEDARPLIAQLDPATRQLTPILQFVGQFKPELTAFFANTVASSEAKDPGTGLHYLRTMNPLNLENLAVYPKRLGTNRTNAYAKSGNFLKLQKGMPSFETRHCGRPVPGISNTLPPGVGPSTPGLPVPIPPGLTTDQINQIFQTLVPQSLLDNLQQFVVGPANNSQTAAPPCYSQGKYTFGGVTTQYPHVNAK